MISLVDSCTWAGQETAWGVTRDETRVSPEAWTLRFLGTDGVLGAKEVPVFLTADAL